MMQKSRFSKWKILGALILCVCVFSCNEDDWGESRRSASGKKSKHVNSELTLAAAQQWYNQTQTPVAQMGVSTRSGASPTLVKPGWESGKESNRGRYEVVETPLKTKGGHLLLDSETAANFDPLNPDKSIRNTARMVVMKDIKTGYIRSFIMVFVGSYDYLKTTKNMGRNTYLYREPDFDGSVLFYELDGRFINGWQYKEGKIVASISKSYRGQSNNMVATRAIVEDCTDWCYTRWDQECDDYSYWEEDDEWGATLVVVGYCYDIYEEECYQHCTYYDDGSDDDWWDDDWWNYEDPPGSVDPPTTVDPPIVEDNGPKDYEKKDSDKLAKDDMPTSMHPQETPNNCVTAIMEFLNNEFFGGNLTEGEVILWYYLEYGEMIASVGVDLDNMGSVVDKYFETDEFTSFQDAIDSGNTVMTDAQTDYLDEGSIHNVLVVGYTEDDELIFMDPEDGKLKTASEDYLGNHYNYNISGSK